MKQNVISGSLIFFLLIRFPVLFVHGQNHDFSWMKKIGDEKAIKRIHTIKSVADVTVSDGKKYTVSTLYHDRQRAIFKRTYSDRTITLGLEGEYYWQFDGTTVVEVNRSYGDFILGHQIHAQLIYFSQLHDLSKSPEPTIFNGKNATKYSSADGWSLYTDKHDYPVGMTHALPEILVTFTFSDFKVIDKLKLPFTILIEDGTRKFTYRYGLIQLNQGILDEFRPAYDLLTEEQKLLRLHRTLVDDHFFERSGGIQSGMGDSLIILNQGNVYQVMRQESSDTIDKIMSSRIHHSYDDLIRPIVKISTDGSLGWVIARIKAKGVRVDENGKETGPLEFICSWIMLYEKIDGQWKNIGNASTFE